MSADQDWVQKHAALKKERDGWRLLAEARGELLVCYRIGSQAKESTFKKLDAARAILGEAIVK